MSIGHFENLFSVTQYPAGEQHVTLTSALVPDVIIASKVRDFNGIMQCVVGHEICKRGFREPRWVIPYMPFARDDRRNHVGEGLELTHAIEMLSKIPAAVVDPHSDVAGILPHYTQAQVVEEFRTKGLFHPNAIGLPVVAIPDAGAAKKVYSWLPPGMDTIQCLKKRDPLTGKLSGFQVIGDDLDNRPVVIVDDLCDAGGTFLGLAKALEEKGAGELTLAVTHGLFTKGTAELSRHFDQIFTLDIYAHATEKLTTLPLVGLIGRHMPV